MKVILLAGNSSLFKSPIKKKIPVICFVCTRNTGIEEEMSSTKVRMDST